MDDLEAGLRKYVQAVQDQENMTKYSGKRSDPFIASLERYLDKSLLTFAMFDA
ncbi:hypothetical protein BDV12DRAFT_193659 [Aspergillus spectabilis]